MSSHSLLLFPTVTYLAQTTYTIFIVDPVSDSALPVRPHIKPMPVAPTNLSFVKKNQPRPRLEWEIARWRGQRELEGQIQGSE